MRTSVSVIISVLAVFCFGLLVSGCESQTGAQAQSPCCRMWTTLRAQGYESAVKYRAGDLPAYRLVIALSPLSENGRSEFLRGFRRAYFDANDSLKGQAYSNILVQSLRNGHFAEAVVQGKKYVNGESTDTRIQELISGSVGLSRGTDLGWKAGYIAGFAREMARQRSGFEDRYYKQAETKYNALRGSLGV
jgi:hypothetical protein